MAKYIDSEKLIAEIERYKQGAAIARFDNAGENADYFQGKVDLCDDLTLIIASLLQEQQDDLASLISEATNVAKRIVDRDSFYNSLPQNLRDKYTSKAWCEILEALSTMNRKEQPEVDLEKEIDNVIADYSFVKTIDSGGFKTTVLDYAKIARHFFELGQKEMRKRLSNPEYNKEVIEKMKSEYPDSKEGNK